MATYTPANKRPFSATIYKGRPAIFDSVTRVFYTGYKTQEDARRHAEQLNSEK